MENSVIKERIKLINSYLSAIDNLIYTCTTSDIAKEFKEFNSHFKKFMRVNGLNTYVTKKTLKQWGDK